MLEKVQRWAARSVKGDYSCDATVTDMFYDLQWKSLELCREQFSSQAHEYTPFNTITKIMELIATMDCWMFIVQQHNLSN